MTLFLIVRPAVSQHPTWPGHYRTRPASPEVGRLHSGSAKSRDQLDRTSTSLNAEPTTFQAKNQSSNRRRWPCNVSDKCTSSARPPDPPPPDLIALFVATAGRRCRFEIFRCMHAVPHYLLYVFVFFPRADKAQIIRLSFSSGGSSWIGQTVQLTCETDGVPEPNITLYKPDNTTLAHEGAETSTADVVPTGAEDFGDYRCQADNGFSPAATAFIKLAQIGRLHAPSFAGFDCRCQCPLCSCAWCWCFFDAAVVVVGVVSAAVNGIIVAVDYGGGLDCGAWLWIQNFRLPATCSDPPLSWTDGLLCSHWGLANLFSKRRGCVYIYPGIVGLV